MVTRWPNKDEREVFEVGGFIAAYSRLPGSAQLEVVQKGDRPDYTVRDVRTGQEYGLELTSVYFDDRSVPDVHRGNETGPVWIPDDEAELERYRTRLAGAVLDKICKARQGYDCSRPLILGVYVNEYISIYMPASEVQAFVKRYHGLFEAMAPFDQVVFWNLPNDGVLCARPSASTNG